MSRRRQRQKGKRQQYAIQSRDRLLNLIYDVQNQPLEHRRLYASHLHKISRRHRLRFTNEAKEVVCRVCSSLMVHGVTCRVRLRNGIKIIQCLSCNSIRRLPYKNSMECQQ